jgi:hypothetical protein
MRSTVHRARLHAGAGINIRRAMRKPTIGKKAPAFDLPATGGRQIELSELAGRKVRGDLDEVIAAIKGL